MSKRAFAPPPQPTPKKLMCSFGNCLHVYVTCEASSSRGPLGVGAVSASEIDWNRCVYGQNIKGPESKTEDKQHVALKAAFCWFLQRKSLRSDVAPRARRLTSGCMPVNRTRSENLNLIADCTAVIRPQCTGSNSFIKSNHITRFFLHGIIIRSSIAIIYYYSFLTPSVTGSVVSHLVIKSESLALFKGRLIISSLSRCEQS